MQLKVASNLVYDPELLAFLVSPLSCWDCRRVPSCSYMQCLGLQMCTIHAMPGIECRAFCMLSERSTNSHISSTSDNVEAISFCLSPVKVWEHNSYTTSDTPELNTTQFLTHSLVLFSTSSVWSPDILTLWLICLTHHVLRYLCLLKLELFDTRKLLS